LAALIFAGCGSPTSTTGTSPAAPNLTGNWQIQTDAGTQLGLLLLGSLNSNGSQVMGTFRFTNLSEPTSCGLSQLVTLIGTIDSNKNLTLSSATQPNGTTIKVALGIAGAQPYSGTGTMEVDGTTCAFASMPAIADEFANTSGIFTGTISPGTLGAPASGTLGTSTLTLVESSSPGADGQFSATGSLNYAIGTCSGSIALTGDLSGVGVTLSGSNGASPFPQSVSMVGTTDQLATTMTVGYAVFVPAPCSSSSVSNAYYFGTLNRQ
jgi:hypothetical protein